MLPAQLPVGALPPCASRQVPAGQKADSCGAEGGCVLCCRDPPRRDSSQTKSTAAPRSFSLCSPWKVDPGWSCQHRQLQPGLGFAVLAPHSPHHPAWHLRADPAGAVGTAPGPSHAHLISACACAAPPAPAPPAQRWANHEAHLPSSDTGVHGRDLLGPLQRACSSCRAGQGARGARGFC